MTADERSGTGIAARATPLLSTPRAAAGSARARIFPPPATNER